MDITSLFTVEKHEAGAELQVVSPLTGEPTEFYIKLAGVDSLRFRNARDEISKKMVEAMREGDEYESGVELLVAATIDWRGLENDGKDMKFSEKRARELYTASPGIAEQADRFIGNRKNYA